MNKSYRSTIKDGREIYIPTWPVDVALQNLTRAGKLIGTNSIIQIAELNVAASIVAVMQCEDPATVSAMIKHFVCQVRIDGSKITPDTINEMFSGDLHGVVELFTHVIHSQYSDFFDLGLAKVNSQEQ